MMILIAAVLAATLILSLIFKLKPALFPIERKRAFTMSIPAAVAMGFVAAIFLEFFRIKNVFGNPDIQLWIYLCIIAPVIEELLFRHALFGICLKYNISGGRTMLITSALFGLFHLVSLRAIPEEYAPFIILQSVFAFFAGLLFSRARWLCKSIVPPIALHALLNFTFLGTLCLLGQSGN